MELEARLIELTQKLEQLAVEHGPETIELAGSVGQASAIHALIWPLALLAAALIPAWLSYRCIAKYQKRENRNEDGWMLLSIVPGICATLAGGTSLIMLVANLTNPVLWWATADPYFALAAQVLGKL